MLALAVFFWSASSIVLATVTRFLENPAFLVVTQSSDTMMKFPSVVLCPELTFPEHRVDKFLSEIDFPPDLTQSEIKPVINQLAAFYSPDVTYSTHDLRMIEQLLDYNAMTVTVAARLLTASCEETLLRCRLFGVTLDCSKLFTMELTSYGFCCIFNGRSLRNSDFPMDANREGQLLGLFNPTPPTAVHTKDVGPTSSLMFVVNNSQLVSDVDVSYKWVYLGKGLRYAEVGGNGTPISPNTETWFGYKTKRFYITSNSKNMNAELRSCRLSSAKLKYFPNYSRKQCMLECQIEHTIDRCDCRRTNHPRPLNVPHCRVQSLLCAENSAVTTSMCDCPPTCDSEVEVTVVQSYPLSSSNFTTDNFYHGLNLSKVTVVRAYLLIQETKLYSRRPFFTALNLFSQIGNIFSVFFGCSVLTIIEVIQLIWHGYLEYKELKVINRKPELILPAIEKKISLKKKILEEDKVVILQEW